MIAALLPALALAWSSGHHAALVIVLLVAGFLFLFLELFVIPGFGVTGVMGLLCLSGGTALAWLKLGAVWGLASLGGGLLLTVLLVLLFSRTRAGKRMVLDQTLSGSVAVASDDTRLIGAVGVAFTLLRPTGIGEFGTERVTVETEGAYVAPGARIRAIAVHEGRLVVEPVTDPDPSTSDRQGVP
jgi:membrane-bound serine protease (ClpP class)